MARFALGQHQQARASPPADKSNHQSHHDCTTIASSTLASSHIGEDSTSNKPTARNKSVSFESDHDDSPTKDSTVDNTLTMTDEDAIAQQHQERYSPSINIDSINNNNNNNNNNVTPPNGSSFHHPNMIPIPIPSGMNNNYGTMPQFYTMIPTTANCGGGPMMCTHEGYYRSCSNSNSSPGGSHVSGGGGSHHSHHSQPTHNTLNETFESKHSLSSACVKPCEGVGRIVGKTINGFLNGCTSVLDNYENLCNCPFGNIGLGGSGDGHDNGHGLKHIDTTNTTNSLAVDMMSSNGDWANTPHPITPLNGSGGSDNGSRSCGDLTEKMDELLKLLKDKESSPTPIAAAAAADCSLNKEEMMVKAREDLGGGDDDHSTTGGDAEAAEEESDKFPNIIEEEDDDAFNRANSLIGMFKNMNPMSKFSRLDESAISKNSEVLLGIGGIGNDLLLDPTVDTTSMSTKASSTTTMSTSTDIITDASDDDANADADLTTPGTKALMDELSFDFNHYGLSISGKVDPRDENKVAAAATALGTTSGRPPIPVATLTSRSPSLPVVAPLSKKEKENNNVKRSFSAPMDSSITKAPTSSTANITATKPSKGQQGKMRRGQRVKKMLKDIKNVPLNSHSLGINGKNKKSLSPFRSIKPKSRAVNITVEDRRNDSSERFVVNNNSSNNNNKHISNSSGNSGSRREQTFVANFSSTEMTKAAGIDPMGFPLSSKSKSKSKSKDIQKMNSWESSFTNKDNPFATTTAAVLQQQQTQRIPSPTTPKAANKTKNINATKKTLTTQTTKAMTTASVSEIRICAWCRKGGLTNPEIIKKLQLCSQCQVTYYCGPECQTKDWINGHAKTCQPASMAMY
mmetsp:Transcript_27544/g.57492  ORF Transcript_27544/g.57492 Transcript_27544/m.57492 type:complete len:856 (-) Transcript_27544:416-2983(-)